MGRMSCSLARMKRDWCLEVADSSRFSARSSNTKSSSSYICSSRNCNRRNFVTSRSKRRRWGDVVESPLVGVAYLVAGPDKPAFVTVGDSVKKGQTLVIIEAMKVMNEIPAPKDGVVTEILVSNEEMVEFGKGLVRIK